MKSVNYTQSGERTPIEQLSIDNDMPLDLACIFIGHNETETEQRIARFTAWLTDIVTGIVDHVRREGIPLNPMGGTIKQ